MVKIVTLSDDQVADIRRDQIENGYTYPLKVTFAGMYEDDDDIPHARVRRISTIDAAVIEALPKDVQETVWTGLKEFQQKQKELEGKEPTNMAEMLSNNGKIVDAASVWCRAAFIHPELVESPDQITDPARQWWVERIAAEDRVGVFLLSVNAESEGMSKIRIFRPEWTPAASDDAALPAPEAALGTLEPRPIRPDGVPVP